MAGLIPLLLQGNRSSTASPSAESRRRSCLSRPCPSSETSQAHRRQQSLPSLKQAKRVSLTVPPALVVMPSSALEWKMTIEEVKRKYLVRKYRSCSMQCCDILDNLKDDASAIEPLHLIYLHFYAASSFEWCARPLSSSSAYRTRLLRDAQAHYAEAEALIKVTECNLAERARSPSSVSTTTSPQSPGLSACSRTSGSSSSATSSPRTSVFSLDDEVPAPAQPTRPRARVKPKKKVSFSSLPEFFEFQPEPYIRPDSPTLGWTDGAHMLPPPLPEMDTFCLALPRRAMSPTSIIKLPFEENMTPPPLRLATRITTSADKAEPVGDDDNNNNPTTTPVQEYNQERSSTPSNHVFDLESFLQTRSLNRFCAQLSALRDQVCRHRAAVDDLLTDTRTYMPCDLSAIQLEVPVPPQQPRPTCASSTITAAPSHKRQRSVDQECNHSTDHQNQKSPRPARPALRLVTNMSDSNVSTTYHHLRRCASETTGLSLWRVAQSPPAPVADTLTPLSAGGGGGGGGNENLQERIERLRASGWRRRRFDSRRYEVLREQVLGELGPTCC